MHKYSVLCSAVQCNYTVCCMAVTYIDVVVLVKRVNRICSPLREFFSRAVIEVKKKLSFRQQT